MIRISFLLPCYKVEKYIQECLDSIYRINLSADEFEVLCFNDCSPDGTADIIRENIKRHPNLRLYNAKENVGSGGGRNALLKVAQGRFIWFVDPDDVVISKMVVPMLELSESKILDVLVFNYSEMTENRTMLDAGSHFADTDVMDGLTFVDSIFKASIVNDIGFPWRFLISREFLLQTKLLFPERIVFQDTVWMPKLMYSAARIQASQMTGYIYWHHETSVCGVFDKSYPAQSIYTRCITICQMVLDFSKELDGMKSSNGRYEYYAGIFHDFAVSHYLNGLPLMLCRTSNNERKKFYQILKAECVPSNVAALADGLTWMCLNPYLGYLFSSILSMGYKLTHKRK